MDVAADQFGLPVRGVDPLAHPLLDRLFDGRAARRAPGCHLERLLPGLEDRKLGIGAERGDCQGAGLSAAKLPSAGDFVFTRADSDVETIPVGDQAICLARLGLQVAESSVVKCHLALEYIARVTFLGNTSR